MRTDEEILRDVTDELKWDPILQNANIGMNVHDGIVTLTGNVDSYGKRVAAENAVWAVKGVTAVAEELNVQLAPHDVVSDYMVAKNILMAFKLNTYVPEGEIKIAVTNGNVKLAGEVDWNFQKDQADNTINNLRGTKSSVNSITIKPED
ncbi:BON domain-containing protein [Mucilaginibacter sp.]|uniref:BON domain-containing protein n=1 Tax=Mucilaginibacter sp. TaxID=1882438 RepID=UPI0032673BFC